MGKLSIATPKEEREFIKTVKTHAKNPIVGLADAPQEGFEYFETEEYKKRQNINL